MTWDNSCLDNLLLQLQLFDSISCYFQKVQEFILNKDPTLLDNFLDVSKRELMSTFYKLVIIWIVRTVGLHFMHHSRWSWCYSLHTGNPCVPARQIGWRSTICGWIYRRSMVKKWETSSALSSQKNVGQSSKNNHISSSLGYFSII